MVPSLIGFQQRFCQAFWGYRRKRVYDIRCDVSHVEWYVVLDGLSLSPIVICGCLLDLVFHAHPSAILSLDPIISAILSHDPVEVFEPIP